MKRPRSTLQICILALAMLGGCATVNPRDDYQRVDEHVSHSTGIARPERPEDAAAARKMTAERLAGGISVGEAMELCLLNNPRVRAAYLNVGVARADFVQAGLFQNPALSISLRLPDGGGLANLELSVAQNIADLWLMPARKRAAEGDLQRETLGVARAVAIAVLDTRSTYFAALAADRELEIACENRELAQQLVDAAQTRRTAGVGSEIDVNLARTELMQTEIAERRAELAAFEARRRLAELLGLWESPDTLVLTDVLPDAPDWSPTDALLLDAAGRCRLDLVAADFVVAATAARVEQEKMSVVSDVELGVSFERSERGRRGDRPWLADTLWASAEAGDPSAPSLRPREKLPTNTVLGPTLSFELPIFDQNQAQIARAELLHEAAKANQAALMLEVTHETRGALRRARAAWDLARYYRDNLLPLLQTNLDLSREAYRGGKLSVLEVLEAQKSLLATRGRYVESLRDSAIAVTDLEKAIGLPVDRLMQLPTVTTLNEPN